MKRLAPLGSVLEALNYGYDASGNRTSMNRQSVTLPLRSPVTDTNYNEANQMLRYNAASDNISYDENGNMTLMTNSCGTTNYTWDARNRLVGITGFKPDCTALTASFKYDALGRRTEKTINGRTIQYLYDGLDVVQEIENSAVSVNYVRTMNIDEPLLRITPNALRFYQQDALGSVIALSDESGTVRTTYSYDPFGAVTISGEASENPFQYTGRENDNTGLYYYRARYYSPELQRFVSEDPIGLAGGINFFVYIKNRPTNAIDPFGLYCITIYSSLYMKGTGTTKEEITGWFVVGEIDYPWLPDQLPNASLRQRYKRIFELMEEYRYTLRACYDNCGGYYIDKSDTPTGKTAWVLREVWAQLGIFFMEKLIYSFGWERVF